MWQIYLSFWVFFQVTSSYCSLGLWWSGTHELNRSTIALPEMPCTFAE
jgi:hypothetical protein